MLSLDELINTIVSQSGLSKDVIVKKINDKVEEFGGLITKEGAAFAVAHDLGITIRTTNESSFVKISDLKPGTASFYARIITIYPPRHFNKNGRQGRVCNLIVGDETGTIRLVLWHRDVDLVEKGVLKRGDAIRADKVLVKDNQGKLEAHTTVMSRIEKVPDDEVPNIPVPESGTKQIANLAEGMRSVDLFAKVIRVGKLTTFDRDDGTGKVVRVLIGDSTGKINLVMWNDLADLAANMKPGDVLRIENAYTKQGMNELELHISKGLVVINPAVHPDLPEFETMLTDTYTRKFVSDLIEGDSNVLIRAMPVHINSQSLFYKVCAKCGSTLQEGTCLSCGSTEPKNALVLSFDVDDGTGTIRAVAFRANVERILNLPTHVIENKVSIGQSVEDITKPILGRDLLLAGRVKYNLSSDRLEFIVSDVISSNPDPVSEAKVLLSRFNKSGE